jgi:hypothetical protein
MPDEPMSDEHAARVLVVYRVLRSRRAALTHLVNDACAIVEALDIHDAARAQENREPLSVTINRILNEG